MPIEVQENNNRASESSQNKAHSHSSSKLSRAKELDPGAHNKKNNSNNNNVKKFDKPNQKETRNEQNGNDDNSTNDNSANGSDEPEAAKTETTSFDDMNLKLELLRGIYSYGFEKPTPIQSKAILPMLTGRDIIAQAQSGTGKTGTFGIGSLQRLNATERNLQIVILSPTRELAQQSGSAIKCLSDFMNINVCICIGGTRIQPHELKAAQILVGTPGRVYDMMTRGILNPKTAHMFILDEADEMLSYGFRDAIYDIFQLLPSTVQVCLFSATMPQDCLDMSERFMRDPIKILVKKEMVTLAGIKQFYIACGEDRFKLETLVDIYDTISVCQAIIFCNSRRRVEWLADQLEQRDFTVSWVHGDTEFKDRELVMKQFRSGASRILITTNLVARGINVQTVSLVVNYDLPRDRESYIHRIGRGGRYGRKGVAISLVNDDQGGVLHDLERFYDTEIKEMPMNIAEMF